MPRRQQPQPHILRDVGILIFVDHDVAEPALILRQHIRMVLEDRHHMQQQIAKIDGIQFFKAGLILGVELGAAMVIGAGIGHWHALRRQSAVFPVVDDPGQHPRGPAFVIDPGGLDQLLQEADLIVSVQNGEIRLQPGQFCMAAQQLDADRVKGAKPGHALGRLAQHPADPLFHLARRLVGKGHGEDLIRARLSKGQQMHDPGGQRLGLAGAGARQHQNRPVQAFHGVPLGRVQPVQIGLGARSHGAGGEGSALKGVHFIETAHGRDPSVIHLRGKGDVHTMFTPLFYREPLPSGAAVCARLGPC